MSTRRLRKIVLLVLAVLVGAGWSGDHWPERRQRIEAMTVVEKEELRRRLERFAALAPAEQERLRRLHRDIETDSEADHLRVVMDHYHRWLMTLSSYHRAELQQLEPAERIKRIKSMLDDQTVREKKRLTPQDLAALTTWMEQYAVRHEARYLEMIPENQRQNYQKAAPTVRPRLLFGMVWWRWQRWGGSKAPALTEEDLASLRAVLSSDARSHIDGKPPAEQRMVAAGWIRQAVQQHMGLWDMKSQPGLSDEDLARFFEKEVTDQQRDHLLSLPNEEMQRDLRQMYVISKRGSDLHGRPDRAKKKVAPDLANPLKQKKPRPKETGPVSP